MYNAASNGKLKPRRFYYLIHLPFVHRANGSSSPVRLLMKEQWMLSVNKRMLSVCKQTKRMCPSMAVYGLFAIFLPFSSFFFLASLRLFLFHLFKNDIDQYPTFSDTKIFWPDFFTDPI
jgi:hypothetical protein